MEYSKAFVDKHIDYDDLLLIMMIYYFFINSDLHLTGNLLLLKRVVNYNTLYFCSVNKHPLK